MPGCWLPVLEQRRTVNFQEKLTEMKEVVQDLDRKVSHAIDTSAKSWEERAHGVTRGYQEAMETSRKAMDASVKMAKSTSESLSKNDEDLDVQPSPKP